jgi:hypothetical protein
MATIISLEKKRALAARVVLDGYYTDGCSLVQATDIGHTGCVTTLDVSTSETRCFAIERFRREFWLVKGGER